MQPSATLTPELLAGLGSLKLQAECLLIGTLAGMHASPFQGFSAEFDQYRGYTPGDDPRSFDWRIFGRTGQTMVKRFRDESNTSLYLILDSSASMGYTVSQGLPKLRLAGIMAGALATLAYRQRDGIGLYSGSAGLEQSLAPRSGGAQYREVLNRLQNLLPQGQSGFKAVLASAAQRMKSGSMVFVFTDLWQNADDILAGLKQIRAKNQAVSLVHLATAQEKDLKDRGEIVYRDLESGETLRLTPETFRQTYGRAFAQHVASVRVACRDVGIRFHGMDLDLPLELGFRELIRDFGAKAGS